LGVTWALGIYGLVFGALLLGLSFNLRKLEKAEVAPGEDLRDRRDDEDRRAA
jgi:hypothetical protein